MGWENSDREPEARLGAQAGVECDGPLGAGLARRERDHGHQGGGDQSLAPTIAAEHGVDGESWDAAVAGWNQRMADDPSVGSQFSAHYRNAE